MEPKFLRDMREENEGQGEAMIAAAPDMLKALRTIEFDVRGRCTACFGWDVACPEKLQGATIAASAMQMLAYFILESAIRVTVRRRTVSEAEHPGAVWISVCGA